MIAECDRADLRQTAPFACASVAPYNFAFARGGIAQLGERLHGMQEVSGSIPLTSTTDTGSCFDLVRGRSCCSASPSSRGLGHHPFTVSTGVRIPLGTP